MYRRLHYWILLVTIEALPFRRTVNHRVHLVMLTIHWLVVTLETSVPPGTVRYQRYVHWNAIQKHSPWHRIEPNSAYLSWNETMTWNVCSPLKKSTLAKNSTYSNNSIHRVSIQITFYEQNVCETFNSSTPKMSSCT